jgi:hypothetical protein
VWPPIAFELVTNDLRVSTLERQLAVNAALRIAIENGFSLFDALNFTEHRDRLIAEGEPATRLVGVADRTTQFACGVAAPDPIRRPGPRQPSN